MNIFKHWKFDRNSFSLGTSQVYFSDLRWGFLKQTLYPIGNCKLLKLQSNQRNLKHSSLRNGRASSCAWAYGIHSNTDQNTQLLLEWQKCRYVKILELGIRRENTAEDTILRQEYKQNKMTVLAFFWTFCQTFGLGCGFFGGDKGWLM